jgi:hypothetical protein
MGRRTIRVSFRVSEVSHVTGATYKHHGLAGRASIGPSAKFPGIAKSLLSFA